MGESTFIVEINDLIEYLRYMDNILNKSFNSPRGRTIIRDSDGNLIENISDIDNYSYISIRDNLADTVLIFNVNKKFNSKVYLAIKKYTFNKAIIDDRYVNRNRLIEDINITNNTKFATVFKENSERDQLFEYFNKLTDDEFNKEDLSLLFTKNYLRVDED